MGMFSNPFKSVTKFVSNVVKSPFKAVKDAGRTVKSLAQGDISGALGNAVKAGTGLFSFGTIGDGGVLIDTKIKDDVIDVTDGIDEDSEKPIISFLDTSVPSLVLGADATEETKKKKASSTSSGSFLGGVGSSSSLLV